jgi:hypothetical protein
VRISKPICSKGDYYTDDKDYQSACGGYTRSTNNKPLHSKLEYIICEDMKLAKFNPNLPSDVDLYWKDRL